MSAVLTIDSIKDVVTDYFKDKPVKSVYLFGSYARGEEIEESDVDLLIQYKDKSRLSVYDVIGFKIGLEDLFRKQVDLVEDGFIYPRLVNYIQNDKVLLFFNK